MVSGWTVLARILVLFILPLGIFAWIFISALEALGAIITGTVSFSVGTYYAFKASWLWLKAHEKDKEAGNKTGGAKESAEREARGLRDRAAACAAESGIFFALGAAFVSWGLYWGL